MIQHSGVGLGDLSPGLSVPRPRPGRVSLDGYLVLVTAIRHNEYAWIVSRGFTTLTFGNRESRPCYVAGRVGIPLTEQTSDHAIEGARPGYRRIAGGQR